MQPNTSQNMSLKAWHTLEAKTNKRDILWNLWSWERLSGCDEQFGVKAPIRSAVLTEDFSYQNAQDTYDYLTQFFQNDSKNII